MPSESDNYPALMNLNRAYFNQDVDVLISPDPDEVVRVFKEELSVEYIEETVQDIRRFLSLYGKDDTQLTNAFERVFRPEVNFYNVKGRTTREGLEKVIEILSNPPKMP
jgi:predicted nucleotidyltransferase